MSNTKKYCSYNKYHVIYDTITNCFDIYYRKKPFVKDVHIEDICDKNGRKRKISDFSVSDVKHSVECYEDNTYITLNFIDNKTKKLYFVLRIIVSNDNVCLNIICDDDITLKFAGNVACEENSNDIFPVSIDGGGNDFRCAIGKASTTQDHALYNRNSDYAISLGKPGKVKFVFNHICNCYTFFTTLFAGEKENIQISFNENVLSNMYDIIFSPINKNSTFSKVPVGWMTWYAVKFDASEEKVLENAKWQSKNLKDYGANAIWVDWEWYHNDMSGNRSDGINSLNPDLKMYPHGMKYVADKIKQIGLVPAIWLGITNEPSKNDYIEKYPDMILADDITWCGRYYLDFSNPHYLNDYLPAVLSNVHKWGYKAIKLDTLPIAFSRHERYHDNMYDASLTTYDAYRGMITKVREELGENMYMLSCSGSTNSTVLWASDIFESARIGEDIFTWEEYRKNAERIMDFYPLHNIQLYIDPDNVVMRDEFNNFEQAKSRVALTSLLGLPMTFGDEFSALSEDRIHLIKKSLPILDIHPTNMFRQKPNDEIALVNLAIDKEFETYQVSGLFNFTDKPQSQIISITTDLHLENDKYLVYDFFRNKFLGLKNNEMTLDFLPFECRVLALRRYMGIPQIISTSRHISQGAAELSNVQYKDDRLDLCASLIANDKYTVTLFVPDGYKIKEYWGFENVSFDNNSANSFKFFSTASL